MSSAEQEEAPCARAGQSGGAMEHGGTRDTLDQPAKPRVDLLVKQLQSVQARWEVERAAILAQWATDKQAWERERQALQKEATLRQAFHKLEVCGFVEELASLTVEVETLKESLEQRRADTDQPSTPPLDEPALDQDL